MIPPELTLPLDLAPLEGQFSAHDYTDSFGRQASLLLLRHQGQLMAYQNICPHWAIPMPPEEIVLEQGQLYCPFHGACFEAQSGLCTDGPPIGQRLNALRVEVDQAQRQLHIFRAARLSFV